MERRLAAIMAADVVGSSGLIEADEAGTLAAIRTALDTVIRPATDARGGRLIKTTGDGGLFEFASAVAAVEAALAIQTELRSRADSDQHSVRLRIGINLGDVVVERGDLYGDGVNVAVRLEGLAEPGGICVSEKVFEELRGRLHLAARDLGPQSLKGLSRAVRAFHLDVGATPGLPRARSYPSLPDKPSLVVLPFDNMGPDPGDDYFADGMVESITTALARLRWLFVIARNSAFTYKGRSVDVRQVGQELGVHYVLEGSVMKAGTRVRLTGQLVDAKTGHHLWADSFDGSLDDIFALQDKLAHRVVVATEPRLRAAEIKRAIAKPTGSLRGYDLYMRALPLLHEQSQSSLAEARPILEAAVALDPTFSNALAALAECIGRSVVSGWIPDIKAGDEMAFEYAQRAIAANPGDGEALATAAWAYATLGGRFDAALDHAERALRIQPNSLTVRNFCGAVFTASGESERAIEQFEAATRLSPVDPQAYIQLSGTATAHFFARNFEKAVRGTGRVLADWPKNAVAMRYRAAALAHLGRTAEAQEVVSQLLQVQPNSSLSRSRHSRFRFPWMYDLYLRGLEAAGLPP